MCVRERETRRERERQRSAQSDRSPITIRDASARNLGDGVIEVARERERQRATACVYAHVSE